MPTLVHPWTEAAKLSVLRKYVYDNSVDIFVAETNVSDLIIGSRGGIDESMLAEANDALDSHFVRADDVIRLGAFDGVEMVATYQHGEMASEETLGPRPPFAAGVDAVALIAQGTSRVTSRGEIAIGGGEQQGREGAERRQRAAAHAGNGEWRLSGTQVVAVRS
jgi:hypothetical protein